MIRLTPPLLSCCAVLATTSLLAGTTTRTTHTSVETIAEREVARRQDALERARIAMESGDRALKERDYETAFAQFKLACDLIPDSPETHRMRQDALAGFCEAACDLSEQRIAEGRYQDAETTAKAVLDERYDPHCHRAIVILAHLEDPDYYNKTITPKFRGDVEEVKRLLREAEGFYQTGRYDLAFKRYEQVLNIDPYNIAARKGQEQVNLSRDNYAVQAYNEARSRAMWKVTKGWENPVRKFGLKAGGAIEVSKTEVRGTEYITNKLNRIVIPRIEFRDATVREAIDFLKAKSRELDKEEPDPTKRGVNIVLKLETTSGGAAPAAAPGAEGGAPAIPGLEAAPGAATAAPAAPAVNPSEARITLSLTNIPLIEALRYITNLANLKFKIDPYAVAVVPVTENVETLITKEYKVPPGFISNAPNASASGSLGAPAAATGSGGADTNSDASKGGVSAITQRAGAKDYLESQGVTFPPGSSANYLPVSSRLIVRNTQANLDLIDAIVEASASAPARQVEIEAKFVEITQNNSKELSFDVLMGPFNAPGTTTNRVNFSGGTAGNGTAVNAADFPFSTTGLSPFNSGLRSGGAAISANAIDALLFPTAGTTSIAPSIFGVQGLLTDPQFQIVMRGINQKKGVDLLSAPRVTTKSGQRAVIEITREFIYPDSFTPPQIPQNFGNNSATVTTTAGAVSGGGTGAFPVTPTTPASFKTRNTGVTLEVEPTIGPDAYTVDLNLVPQVVEFEGFINYGSPIKTVSALGLLSSVTGSASASVTLTDNVINQPIFSTRKVTTSVSVYDGQTVVLGGLMREDVQKVEDKVPLLGDVPLLGRFFRSNVDQHLKRNLVIFVTARLINPAGEAVRQDEETEEVVEPLGLPKAPAQPEAPLFQK